MADDPRFATQNRGLLHGVYLRLGGENGGAQKVQTILIDFYERMAADTMLMHFFMERDLRAIAEKQGEFLLRAMGARESYTGHPPAAAHGNLPPIWQGHFNRRLVLLGETLRDHGVSIEDAQIWLGFENAFRDGIVDT